MNLEELTRLKDAVQTWALIHPTPDEIVIVLSSGETLTPLQLARHLQDETSLGEILIDVVDLAIPRLGFDHILERLVITRFDSDPGATPGGGPNVPPGPTEGGVFAQALAALREEMAREESDRERQQYEALERQLGAEKAQRKGFRGIGE